MSRKISFGEGSNTSEASVQIVHSANHAVDDQNPYIGNVRSYKSYVGSLAMALSSAAPLSFRYPLLDLTESASCKLVQLTPYECPFADVDNYFRMYMLI